MSNYNTTLQSNNTDLQAVLQTLKTKAAGGTQATPVISVNTSGLITATAGAKYSTHQLAFQPAKTIIPGSVSQIVVSSGYYTGGNITVTGDSNLVAENIKNGVSIFGVNGTLTESSDGNSNKEDIFITRSISGKYINDRVTTIGSNAFCNCDKITTVSFPQVTAIGRQAFGYCLRLKKANFQTASSIGYSAFYGCLNLTSAHFNSVKTIYPSAFYNCEMLFSLTIGTSTICTLSESRAFRNTPYYGYSYYCNATPYIYVPSSLIASYKSATNWTYFSNYFSTIESLSETTNDIIIFTIEDVEYQAKEGMTWIEWVNSEYNDAFCLINNNIVRIDNNMLAVVEDSSRGSTGFENMEITAYRKYTYSEIVPDIPEED